MDANAGPAPLVVEDATDLHWDETTDVLVVGFGGAGACAAIEAREAGAEVLAIDRFDGGGATAYSGGVIYSGGTRFQQQAGFEDSAERMYDYLALEVGDVVRPETLRRYCEQSVADLDWLIAHGVPYAADYYPEKTIYPPDGKFLYYSGNERAPDYAAKVPPAPRGHRPVGNGLTGHVYYNALHKAAIAAGVRLNGHETATRLVIDRAGRVIGVETRRLATDKRAAHQRLYAKVVPMLPFKAELGERAGREAAAMEADAADRRLIRARNGVILATGGFCFNLKMMAEHQPFFAKHYRALMRLGSLGCDGSGIVLGQSVGGATDRMDSLYAARNIAPPPALLDGILVNKAGERFIGEEVYSGFLGLAINRQPGGEAYLVLPAASLRKAIKQSVSSGMLFFKFYGVPALLNLALGGTRRARSLDKLARKIGVDSSGLQASVERYQADIAARRPDPMGKSEGHRVSLAEGPYYAVNMSIPNIYAFTYLFTLGGLVVDEDSGAVRREDGGAIAGLYAAGRAAVGLCSNGYLSGMSIGDGMFSGRRAGRSAASAAVALTPPADVLAR